MVHMNTLNGHLSSMFLKRLNHLTKLRELKALELFTKELKSHGYPITKYLCEEKGLCICKTNEELEDLEV